MTRDDIIRMAREAGVRDDGHRFEFSEYKYLERFAALVAAAEREACAKVCDTEWNGDSDTYEYANASNECAEAIRASGQA